MPLKLAHPFDTAPGERYLLFFFLFANEQFKSEKGVYTVYYNLAHF
jgi:hypothetical protein